MILSANLIALVLLSSFSGTLAVEDPRTRVEAISSGSVFVAWAIDERARAVVGRGEMRFSATGDCSPSLGPFPDGCIFDLASLQGSGEIRVAWEFEGTTYSVVIGMRSVSTPVPAHLPLFCGPLCSPVSGASDSSDMFAIWNLENTIQFTTGSQSLERAAPGFILALAPPLGTQWSQISSRFTTILISNIPPGSMQLPITFFWMSWLSEPQTLALPWGGSIDVPAADLVTHMVSEALFAQVDIDIKPGSSPNSVNPGNMGKIPVAILSSPTFDAPSQINASTITFGRTGDEQSLAFCRGSEDVNDDGLLDLVCHFDTQASGFQLGDTQGVLRGRTYDGTALEGTDSVSIIA